MHPRTTTFDVSRRRLARWCGVLVLLPLLTGCVAALAVPAMTAAGVFSERRRVRAATAPTLAPVVTVESAPETDDAEAALVPRVEPPVVPLAPLSDQWRPFVSYTLGRAEAMRGQRGAAQSALLAPDARFSLAPKRLPCRASEPAVVVDLDLGAGTFAPGAGMQPAPGLAVALERLRADGVVVLWLSQVDANRVNEVAQALRDSGLDASGRDPLLLVRNEDERKQVLLEEANEDVCVLAILGDRQSDFDELFDYLRDPSTAAALEVLVGAGWFLVPPPLSPAGP